MSYSSRNFDNQKKINTNFFVVLVIYNLFILTLETHLIQIY